MNFMWMSTSFLLFVVIDYLKSPGRLDDHEKIMPIKDWFSERGGGLRFMEIHKSEPCI